MSVTQSKAFNSKLSPGEELLATHLRAYEIPFKREFKFHPSRRWRFDFFVSDCLAVEVEGAPGRGRHTTAKGFTEDCRKYNAATLLDYKLLRFTTAQVKSGEAIGVILEALGRE